MSLRILPLCLIGRATCNRLDLNDEKRSEGFIQEARKQWVASGLHPPIKLSSPLSYTYFYSK